MLTFNGIQREGRETVGHRLEADVSWMSFFLTFYYENFQAHPKAVRTV